MLWKAFLVRKRIAPFEVFSDAKPVQVIVSDLCVLCRVSAVTLCPQSAQLTRIVNSLMPPFGFSPSSSPTSKAPCRWKGRSKRSLSR